jgi:ribosomal protein L3 glutamine methyltransferase
VRDFEAMAEEAGKELHSIHDFVRWGASRFNEAGLFFGHGTEDAVTEALTLVLHALHLPPGLPDEVLRGRLTGEEKRQVLELLARRARERIPAAYLTHEAWFASLAFYVDQRVLVPRSPIAELIERGFEPWLEGIHVLRALDLCTGSGCMAVACAMAMPEVEVDAADISPDALEVAAVNIERYGLQDRVTPVLSDVYDGLPDVQYDLIISNPPYVGAEELAAMPPEYRHEPLVGLNAGEEGLDVVRRILHGALDHLAPDGVLIVEVGASKAALVSAYARVPFLWLEFERGGEGVFLLTAAQLAAARKRGDIPA